MKYINVCEYCNEEHDPEVVFFYCNECGCEICHVCEMGEICRNCYRINYVDNTGILE